MNPQDHEPTHQTPPSACRLRGRSPFLLVACLGAAACGQAPSLSDNASEVISLVELTFTPEGGGAPLVAAFDDPDGDGGMSGASDPIHLDLGLNYTLEISLRNELVDPPEDITAQVEEEAEQHLFLVAGDAVSGPASKVDAPRVVHAYADHESDYGPNEVGDDLPVGIRNSLETVAAGQGELRIMLRHLPPINGVAQKTAEIPGDFADGKEIAGEVDVDVRFDLTVE